MKKDISDGSEKYRITKASSLIDEFKTKERLTFVLGLSAASTLATSEQSTNENSSPKGEATLLK